jgi:hypothetical protein
VVAWGTRSPANPMVRMVGRGVVHGAGYEEVGGHVGLDGARGGMIEATVPASLWVVPRKRVVGAK